MKRRQLSILSNATIFFTIAAAARIFAQDPASSADDVAAPREMAKRDRDFSALSVEKGMPAACLAYFADDGIAFAPRAVNGKKFWGGLGEFSGTLVWAPIFAASSRATDLGYTTGPWELKKENQAGSFGNYVTIWQKPAGGEWKIALDVGIENPQPTEPPPDLQIMPANIAASGREEARRKYRRSQLAFPDQARQDIGKALLEYVAGEVRVLRDKSFPAIGISAAQILLGSDHGKVVRQSGGTRLSNSADLAYSYGNYSEERGNVNDRGIYVTIWQIDLNGDWKIVLDLQKTVPSGKP